MPALATKRMGRKKRFEDGSYEQNTTVMTVKMSKEYAEWVERFAEFRRVLAPGGVVLLAFQVGDEPLVLTDFDGEQVNLTFIRRRPEVVADLLSNSGFRIYAEMVRQADEGLESTAQAYLIARRAA